MGMAARKQTPEPDPSELVPFNFRMPRGLIDALDERVDALNKGNPWQKINRSDLIRDILTKAMQEPIPAPPSPGKR